MISFGHASGTSGRPFLEPVGARISHLYVHLRPIAVDMPLVRILRGMVTCLSHSGDIGSERRFGDAGKEARHELALWRRPFDKSLGAVMTVEVVNLTKEEIAEMFREIVKEEFEAKLESKLEPLLSAVIVRQKDAAPLAQVSPGTISNKIARGEISVLSRDGSRRNYLTLQTVKDLKPRLRKRR